MGRPIRLPPHAPGLRVGLYGGSFDPPHRGHRHVAVAAMRRLGLDRLWWIVGPGNPLKDRGRLASAAQRAEASRRVAAHPRIVVTDFEAAAAIRYTVDTVRLLRRRCPGTRFAYVMGADSFAGLHRWRDWRALLRLVPVAVVDRPGWTIRAQRSPAARFLAARRAAPEAIFAAAAPRWCFVAAPRCALSSTTLRNDASRHA